MAQNILKIALAQLNPIVGDVAGNEQKAREARAEAARLGADIVMFAEQFLAGYPAEDLVLKPAFQDACRAALERLARETADGGPGMLIGLPWREEGELYNAYALLDGGSVSVRFKVDLPNYGVFDEKRNFAAGPLPGPVNFRGIRLGLPICEDIWTGDVVECLAETGAEMLLVPNGSPYWRGKTEERFNIAAARVTESGLPLVYLNQIGGQDELVFDGASFVLNADCSLACQLPANEEVVALTTWEKGEDGWACREAPIDTVEEGEEADYAACVLGLRDYVDKNRFPGVVLGLSGGIDSAICAAMAVDALGAERVHCVMLPFRYTSGESLKDAEECAKALGVRYDILPIAEPVEGFEAALQPLFAGTGARHHRGEPSEPRPRHHPDGDLEQVRRHGGDDRQQVGNVGGLCHDLRRHERRLQPDQGPVQDGGLPHFGSAQPLEAEGRLGPGRHRHPREHPHQGTHRRAAREPEGPGFPASLRGSRRDPARPRGAGAARLRDRREGL